MSGIHIVKRRGHKEPYDGKKVYASVYAACLNTHMNKEEAENVAEKVLGEIDSWLADKREVASDEIFKKITETLKKHSTDTAFMYETHRDIS